MNDLKDTEMTSAEKAALVLKNNKKYFVMAGIALILILVGIGVVEFMSNQKEEQSIVLAEDIDSSLEAYFAAADEDKSSAKDEVMALIEEAKSDYAGFYAAMRAYNSEALILAAEENWTEAAEAFLYVADTFSDTYIAPIALINASAMMEEAGDNNGAMDILERTLAEYKSVSADIPEVLFNLGRLSESNSDSQKAIEYYEMINNDYSSSNWTNLAKSRIIALKAGS